MVKLASFSEVQSLFAIQREVLDYGNVCVIYFSGLSIHLWTLCVWPIHCGDVCIYSKTLSLNEIKIVLSNYLEKKKMNKGWYPFLKNCSLKFLFCIYEKRWFTTSFLLIFCYFYTTVYSVQVIYYLYVEHC